MSEFLERYRVWVIAAAVVAVVLAAFVIIRTSRSGRPPEGTGGFYAAPGPWGRPDPATLSGGEGASSAIPPGVRPNPTGSGGY